jgi:hypothetical protein
LKGAGAFDVRFDVELKSRSRQENRLFVEGLDGAEEATAVAGEIGAEGERGLRALAAAALGEALAQHDLGALELSA